MSKEIEVGCRAVIVNSKYAERNGTEVTVLFYGFEYDGKPTWIVDVEFKNEDGLMSDKIFEENLNRIGFQFQIIAINYQSQFR